MENLNQNVPLNNNISEDTNVTDQSIIKKKINKKLILIIVIIVLILAGTVLALFTDLRYKIPFFRPDESKLVGLMYEKLSQLDGADFSISYQINVGNRDADVPEPEENKEEEIDDVELTGLEGSDTLEFLSGEAFENSWLMFEDMIPPDFIAELSFFGKGFSFAQREKNQNRFPDIEIGLTGSGKMGSVTMSLDMEARAVNDELYYKVSEFPYIDITKGHQGEWIKISPEDGIVGEVLPEYDKQQQKVIGEFRNFIVKTQEFNILEFEALSKKIEVEGDTARLFNVKVNAKNIPGWLESARAIALESDNQDTLSFLKLKTDSFTEEEKIELVKQIDKVLQNITIIAGINESTGDLMYLETVARLIPPAKSKKFNDKQFNSILTLKLWNQNSPSEIEAPHDYVDQEVIEQEDLGLSNEEYQDYKQAQRITNVRKALAEYHLKNKKFPDKLADVTRLDVDRNTNKPYIYSVSDNNYNLTYTMNTDTSDSEATLDLLDNDYNLDYVNLQNDYKMDIGSNPFTRKNYYWHSGENIADRYTPIADQYKQLTDLSATGQTNQDIIMALYQIAMLNDTKSKLTSYHSRENKYPASLEELITNENISMAYVNYLYSKTLPTGYLCEDIFNGGYCKYEVMEDGNDYKLYINFKLSDSDINQSKVNIRLYPLQMGSFIKGENVFTKERIDQPKVSLNKNEDTDGDGLINGYELNIGTDPEKKDTDGDGFEDLVELNAGYSPLANKEIYWTKCVSLDELQSCDAYCKSINKVCSDAGITSQGFRSGAELWATIQDCQSGNISAGQVSCDTEIGTYWETKTYWRCYCQ